jgi:hypothetical protein
MATAGMMVQNATRVASFLAEVRKKTLHFGCLFQQNVVYKVLLAAEY